MKLIFKILFLLSIVIVWLWLWIAKVDKTQVYQVKKGVGFSQVSKDLNSLPVLILSTILQTKLKAGYYQIKKNMRVIKLLKKFDNSEIKIIKVVLIEGKTIEQYFSQLSQNPRLKNMQTLAEIMQSIGVKKPYEGQFFPDTYRVNYGDSVASILNRANQSLQKKLNKTWQARVKNHPLNNANQLLILASIIERETAKHAEKAKIAGVFINRLKKNMRLQTDPTVIYALGETYKGKLSKQDLRVKSPYNTYRNKGLPPGAISSVGMASLEAAAHPLQSDYLYFVAKKNGTHAFAKTYKQHLKNINKHLK